MGDVVKDANVVRLACRGVGRWTATVGPDDGRGLEVTAASPYAALVELAHAAARRAWPFDETWAPPHVPGTSPSGGDTRPAYRRGGGAPQAGSGGTQ